MIRNKKIFSSNLADWDDSYVPDSSFENEVSPELEQIASKIKDLEYLEDGWSGYNSRKPSTDAIFGAGTFAAKMLNSSTPLPDIFPVPNGNIQFEWSCYQIDLEIEVESVTSYHVSFEDNASGAEWEKSFSIDLSEIADVLRNLSRSKTSRKGLQLVNE